MASRTCWKGLQEHREERQIPKWPSWQKDVTQNLINLNLKPEILEASALNSSLHQFQEWTLVYHDGPLKGRCEPLKLLLEDGLELWGFGIGPGGEDVGASFFKHLVWDVELGDSWHGLGFERIWWLAFPVLSRFRGLGLRGLGLRLEGKF